MACCAPCRSSIIALWQAPAGCPVAWDVRTAKIQFGWALAETKTSERGERLATTAPVEDDRRIAGRLFLAPPVVGREEEEGKREERGFLVGGSA